MSSKVWVSDLAVQGDFEQRKDRSPNSRPRVEALSLEAMIEGLGLVELQGVSGSLGYEAMKLKSL